MSYTKNDASTHHLYSAPSLETRTVTLTIKCVNATHLSNTVNINIYIIATCITNIIPGKLVLKVQAFSLTQLNNVPLPAIYIAAVRHLLFHRIGPSKT